MFKLDDRHQWIRDADLTYCAARHLLHSEDVFFRAPAGYLLHQAMEKYFKALRKILRPQIPEREGGHDLCALHASVTGKAKGLDTPEISRAIDKINSLKDWRYVDKVSSKSRQAMSDGLSEADLVVASVRGEIPDELLLQGLPRILSLGGGHRRLLVKALFENNSQQDYWKSALSGISEVDSMIRKYSQP
jgi:hypothetical protein